MAVFVIWLYCRARLCSVRGVSFIRVVVAVTVGLTVLTACSKSAAEPEKPTFEMAKKTLVDDVTELLGSAEVQRVAGQLRVTERAEKDDTGGCIPPGEVQRFFRAQGDFVRPESQSPGTAAGLIGSRVGLDGYDPVVDSLDLWDNDMSVEVWRKPGAAVTVIIAARTTKPNVLLVGKTDCFKPGE